MRYNIHTTTITFLLFEEVLPRKWETKTKKELKKKKTCMDLGDFLHIDTYAQTDSKLTHETLTTHRVSHWWLQISATSTT